MSGGSWCKFHGANLHLKAWARAVLQVAFRNGTLTRQPCEVCGEKRTDAHHEDYAAPTNVVWLCRLHHSWRHAGQTLEQMRSQGTT